jgi:hypothetical protein
MEDVLAVYERPYRPAEPVVCLDEKPVTLHAETRAPLPMKEGQPLRQDYEYRRCGTANVFCVVEPQAGWHLTRVTPRRTAAAFADTVRAVVDHYPFARTIHLVMDNLNIHRRQSLIERFGQQEGGYLWNRLTVHHTPKHASWLNMAEIEVGLFSRECLGHRRLADLSTLRHEAQAWCQRARRQKRRIQWSFTRKRARKLFHYQPGMIKRS